MTKVELVQFIDGSYGVKRTTGWWIFGSEEYYDFASCKTYWWSFNSGYMKDCRTLDKEKAMRLHQVLSDKGIPV